MTGVFRLDGGLIDRSRPLSFVFNDKTYQGFKGDTLASRFDRQWDPSGWPFV